jgi:hypothetical protein
MFILEVLYLKVGQCTGPGIKVCRIWDGYKSGGRGTSTCAMVGSYSLLDAISVAMEPLLIEHRIFVFETFNQTGSSVVCMQHRFHTHFNVGLHGAVPCRNTILTWVKNFRTTRSVRPGTARGGDQTLRTPENIKRV